MSIVIFDTETTSLEKPFCYNIGYIIADDTATKILQRREYVVEQVWHNTMLFSTAYYAEKRPLYVDAMRRHEVIMTKFGYICQQMIRDFKAYEVNRAFAYNAPFDEKVFNFNCDWFKCVNPFDNIPISDIRGYVHHFIIDEVYKNWCEENHYFTDSGNYSTTAETLFRYISGDNEFNEAHTALDDSTIECQILATCLERGANLHNDYQAFRSINRDSWKTFTVLKNGQVVFTDKVKSVTYKKTTNSVVLR